jgi:hypothetical protein
MARKAAKGDAGGAGGVPPPFEVLCEGSFGGKAAGLLQVAARVRDGAELAGPHSALVSIPPSALLGTDLFDAVVEENGLGGLIRSGPEEGNERQVYDAFLAARLPDWTRARFLDWLSRTKVPLAVRSSSIQEDNPLYSFSGIYRTHFVTNTGSLDRRLAAFEHAVKVVLGSTFLPRAYAYRGRHGIRPDDERMAILVQHVAGKRRGDLFFPLIAGVGFSRNMYPWTDRMAVEDGVVRLVYGLGTRAVGREFARVFVPTQPTLRPEGFSVEAIEQFAQERFDALDLARGTFRQAIPVREMLPVEGNDLELVSSLVREGEFLRAPRFPLVPDDRFVLTFDEIIGGRTALPLVPILRSLFGTLSAALGSPVDIEFACTSAALDPEAGGRGFTLLQVRPLGVREANRVVRIDAGDARVVMRSRRIMGNGEVRGIRHVILVLAEEYLRSRPQATVEEIRRLNRSLEGKPFLLVGPGRWGTTNASLGVPAVYESISGAAAIVEVAAGTMTPEVSYGTHFFGDLLSTGIHYLALVPKDGDVFDREFLVKHSSKPVHGVRLVELDTPLALQVDGHSREAVLFVDRDPVTPGPSPGTRSPPGRG